jgi:hypothetical protein
MPIYMPTEDEVLHINTTHCFGSHLSPSDFNESSIRKGDLKKLDEDLKAKGSSLEAKISDGTIWRMGFPGVILHSVLSSIDLSQGTVSLVCSPAHPHRADLAYKRDSTLDRNISPLTCSSVVLDEKGQIVFGLRGGLVSARKLGIIGGHAEYKPLHPNTNIAERTTIDEVSEELGLDIAPDQIKAIAIHSNIDTNGIDVVYEVHTGLPFHKIEESWSGAKDKYENVKLFAGNSLSYPLHLILLENGLNSQGNHYSLTPHTKRVLEIYRLTRF